MTPFTRPPAPPHPACGLPYHREGARVRLQRWRDGSMETLAGQVVTHRPDRRVITVATAGGEITMSCGSVVSA